MKFAIGERVRFIGVSPGLNQSITLTGTDHFGYEIGDIVKISGIDKDLAYFVEDASKEYKTVYFSDHTLEKIDLKEELIKALPKRDILCFAWDDAEKRKELVVIDSYEVVTKLGEDPRKYFWSDSTPYKNAIPVTKEEVEDYFL